MKAQAPWGALLAIVVAGLAARVGVLAAADIGLPVGGDAAFWGQRALELREGLWIGSHPPGYPLVGLALGSVLGLDPGVALQAVALVSGSLAPAALGLAANELAGRRAGIMAALLAACLPALAFASMRVEPTALLALGIGLASWLAARAARRGAPADALVAGLVASATVLTKENGLVASGLIAVALPFATTQRSVAVTLAFVLGFIPGVATQRALDAGFSEWTGITVTKAELPLDDVRRMLASGEIPHALVEAGAAERQGTGEALRQIAEPARSGASRAILFLGVQLKRLALAMGSWILLVPTALVAGVAKRDPPSRIFLAQALALVPCVLVVVQPRHVDVALLGLAVSAAIAVVGRPLWQAVVPVALVATQLAYATWSMEWEELVRARRCAEAELAVAERLRPQLPTSGDWCSTAAWFPFRLGLPGGRCLLEEVRVGESRAFVVDRGAIVGLRDRGDTLALALDCGPAEHEGCIADTAVCIVTNAGLGPTPLRWRW